MSQVCGVADSCSEITIPALMIDRINGEDFLSEVRWYLSMLEVSHVNSYLLWWMSQIMMRLAQETQLTLVTD